MMRKKNKKKADAKANHDTILTLHKYFLCGNALRVGFDASRKEQITPLDQNYFASDGFRYMLMWYGMLYVVIEGWRKLRLSDAQVTSLLRIRRNVDLLRECRHSVFHFSPEYFDNRFIELVLEGPEMVKWIRDLNTAFGTYFLNFFESERAKKVDE